MDEGDEEKDVSAENETKGDTPEKNDFTWEFFPRCQTSPPTPQYGNAHVTKKI